MELIKKQVHYTQEGKRTFDQFYLDEDYNVPDAKEDVQQIIQGSGTVKIFRYYMSLQLEIRSPL